MADDRALQQRMDGPSLAVPSRSQYLLTLQRMDLAVVRRLAAVGRVSSIRPFALLLNHLGNGWLYPLLALVLWWLAPGQFVLVVLAAGGSAALAHVIYPLIKRKVARPRPFEADPSLTPLLPTLDRFAFPSGHCMTVTAVMVPITVVHAAMLPWAVLTCLLIALARLLAAHHYPSDLFAGMALGALASLPLVVLLI